MVVLSLLVGLAMLVMAILLPFGVAYDRWLRRQLRSTASARAARRPGVCWLAGRWDTEPANAYVANIGDDTAYDVSVTVRDHVIGRAFSVPPYRTARLSSSSKLPCYVNVCVEQSSKRELAVGARAGQDKAFDAVRVSWRSEHNQWRSQTVRTD